MMEAQELEENFYRTEYFKSGVKHRTWSEFIDSDHHDMRNLAAEFNLPLLNLYAHSELKLQQNFIDLTESIIQTTIS